MIPKIMITPCPDNFISTTVEWIENKDYVPGTILFNNRAIGWGVCHQRYNLSRGFSNLPVVGELTNDLVEGSVSNTESPLLNYSYWIGVDFLRTNFEVLSRVAGYLELHHPEVLGTFDVNFHKRLGRLDHVGVYKGIALFKSHVALIGYGPGYLLVSGKLSDIPMTTVTAPSPQKGWLAGRDPESEEWQFLIHHTKIGTVRYDDYASWVDMFMGRDRS